MSSASRLIIFGLLTALFGLGVNSSSPLAELEIEWGLTVLFKLRGPRPASDDIIVVTIENTSSAPFSLPRKPSLRPRSEHADVVRRLVALGVQVIVFDIFFEKPGDRIEDQAFARAIRAAGNVVLAEYLAFTQWRIADNQARVEKWLPPFPELAREALALAPFPLPRVPATINQCWLFKQGAGDIPTLPAAAFYIYALPFYDDLLHLLRNTAPRVAANLVDNTALIGKSDKLRILVDKLGRKLRTDPDLARQLLMQLQNKTVIIDSRTRTLLTALINMHLTGNSFYLDFYGPPGSITTLSYADILQKKHPELSGKVVFIGFSQDQVSEQQKQDLFHTVFARPDGADLTGVEIAATAFGNLLENRNIQPLDIPQRLLLIILWGLVLGTLLLWPSVKGLFVIAGIALTLYLAIADYLFTRNGLWLPLVVPLLFQAPFAILGALLWHYLESRRECQKVYENIGYFLPGRMVTELVQEKGDIASHGELIHGICIFTDAQQYTALSERLSPEQLRSLLNDYFEILFKPITRSGGFISDVVGDAMLALWKIENDDREARLRACEVALDISASIDAFNQKADRSLRCRLPTRVGLHCGAMLLGPVGAGEHYEFRAVGDTVNTVTRIQELNKYLGTRLLVSKEMIEDVEGFVHRELGRFRLAGKNIATIVHELVGKVEQIDPREQDRYRYFTTGLQAFQAQHWEQALTIFAGLLERYGDDGPTRYYLRLGEQYAKRLPGIPWDGIIPLERK